MHKQGLAQLLAPVFHIRMRKVISGGSVAALKDVVWVTRTGQVNSSSTSIFKNFAGPHGFSLLELMLGLAITLIMAAVAVPQLVAVTEEYRLSAVAREVIGNLSNTRILSITHNADYRMVVSDPVTYVVEEDVSGTWTNRATYQMPEGFTIGDNGTTIQFHRWGNASPVATLDITNRNNTVIQVVTGTSGRSYVQ